MAVLPFLHLAGRQDPVGRLPDAGDDRCPWAEIRPVPGAVSRQHIDPGGPGIVSQRDIVRVVAHDKRPGEVQPELASRLFQEKRPGLDAGTLVLPPVGAVIDSGNNHPVPAQFPNNMLVDLLHLIRAHEPG